MNKKSLCTFTFVVFRSTTRFTFTSFKGQPKEWISKLARMGHRALIDRVGALQKQKKAFKSSLEKKTNAINIFLGMVHNRALHDCLATNKCA
jgi:hypothetical protein